MESNLQTKRSILSKILARLEQQPAQPVVLFDGYEITGLRSINDIKASPGSDHVEPCADEDAEIWSLRGHIPGEGVQCIGDFKTREFAEEIYTRITGKVYAR